MDNQHPIDNFIANNIISKIAPILFKLQMTPNHITILGLIIGLMSSYFLYVNSIILFITFWCSSYLMDCLDGYYARKYNMTSQFGDYLDHLSDVTKTVCLFYVLHMKYNYFKNYILFALFCIIFFMQLTHIGCDQKNKNKDNKSLKPLKKLCTNNPNWLRYFGSPTIILYFIFVVIYFSIGK